jgi:phosphotransferase system HPr (HPr) family protein
MSPTQETPQDLPTEVAQSDRVLKAFKLVNIVNPQGFHMRPKAAFAESAGRFQSEVTILWEGRMINGKSMWDLMLVAALPGNEIRIDALGPDAEEAVTALAELIETDTGDTI